MDKKRIIIACDTLLIGGAETFAMRVARYYKENGHQVTLAAVDGGRIDYKLVAMNAGDVEILTFLPNPILNWLLYKLDGLLYRLKRYKGLRRHLTIKKFRQYILATKVDIVHTNMFASLDVFNYAVKNIPEVITIHSVHGDIVDIAYREVAGKELNFYDLHCSKTRLPTILKRLNHLVCTAEMHLKIFRSWGKIDIRKICKIYNPVELNKSIEQITRQSLGIGPGAFIFGSMARCVPSKGWKELCEAFLRCYIPDAYLMLIGDGPYLPTLKDEYAGKDRILFLGAQTDPWRYIKLFDVSVSSSYFWESLPTAIIDYLSMRKPQIVTDNAESRYMIQGADGMAGLVVPLQKDEWGVIEGKHPLDIAELAKAMQLMYDHPEIRYAAIEAAPACYKMFDKNLIMKQYESLFL